MQSRALTIYKASVGLNTRDVNLSGSQNLFGTLGQSALPISTNKSFIPKDANGQTIYLNGEGDDGNAKWIGLGSKRMQFWAYLYCSPLAAVIDRLAEADNNGRVRFVDEDDLSVIKNYRKVPKLSRIRKLLRKPNPWQTWDEFDLEQRVYKKIFGYCPAFAIGPDILDRSYTKALVNLNPIFATPNVDESFNLFKSENRIKNWTLTILNQEYTIPSKDIILFKDGFISNISDETGLPLSKINGLDFFVSNICAAMEADNVILKKKGPLGVFSYDPAKDMAGSVPLDPTAKDDLQIDLARYGLTFGQLQYIISKMPIKWNAMSFNLRDLMTKETIRAGIDGICDRFGYPAELMSGKNATYENRNSSEKFLYQNNIMPSSARDMAQYNNFFELEDGVVLEKNYSHLPVLQEDIVKASEAFKAESEGLLIAWEAGQITWNQWQLKQERDTVEGMDIYYPEYIKQNPSMNKNKPAPVKNKKEKDGKAVA